MVVSHHVVAGNLNLGTLLSLWSALLAQGLFIVKSKYIVAVFRQHQKRVSDFITDGCCWDLNSGPSKEQSLEELLTAKPFLQPA